MKATEAVIGIHAVSSALRLRPHEVRELWVDRARTDDRLQLLIDSAVAHNIQVHHVSKTHLDRLVGHSRHQGVVANSHAGHWLNENQLYTLLDQIEQSPFLLILDCIQDPHNLGACLRSADGAGVDAVILPKDRSVGLTATVRKVASGATDSVPVFQVTNLARVLSGLKQRGIWLYGLAGEATQTLYDQKLVGAVALVLGAEGRGLRRLTRDSCDQLVSLPMAGQVESLNVSVATGICLYEAVRQRQNALN